MKITEFKYTTKGPMGIKYHFTVICTEGGLERAENHLKGRDITARTEKEVESLTEYQGSAADRFKTYFMDGAKRERKVKHPATGTVCWDVYS